MTDDELRRLAEAAMVLHDNQSPTGERYRSTSDSAAAAFRRAVQPDVVIALLDRLASAERVVEAARASVRPPSPPPSLHETLRAYDAMRGKT